MNPTANTMSMLGKPFDGVVVMGVVFAVRVNGNVVDYPSDPIELLTGMGTADQITYDVDVNFPWGLGYIRLASVVPWGFREPSPMRIIPCAPGMPFLARIQGNAGAWQCYSFVEEKPARKGCTPLGTDPATPRIPGNDTDPPIIAPVQPEGGT